MGAQEDITFEDWLSTRNHVPKYMFMYWMREYGARESSMRHFVNIWKKVRFRADVLESILWDAGNTKFKGSQKVGFIVSEIHARI